MNINGIEYVPLEDGAATSDNIQEIYNGITWALDHLKSIKGEAQALYNDMKENGLSVGMIEAEGYLSGITTAVNYVNYGFSSTLDLLKKLGAKENEFSEQTGGDA